MFLENCQHEVDQMHAGMTVTNVDLIRTKASFGLECLGIFQNNLTFMDVTRVRNFNFIRLTLFVVQSYKMSPVGILIR